MARDDHAARARRLLDQAGAMTASIEVDLGMPLQSDDAAGQLHEIEMRGQLFGRRVSLLEQLHAAAQVHATLALVEQQRAANLLAYWQLHTTRVSDADDTVITVRQIDGVDEDELRAAIGIHDVASTRRSS